MGLGPVNEAKRRQRLERLAKVADGYLRCKPAHEIAKELGVVVRAVYSDFAKLREIWAKKAEAGAKAYIASELAKLDRVEREAWEMHERAKKLQKQRTEAVTETEKGTYATVSKTKRTPDVASRWLEIVLACMEKRAKLLKLYEPEISTSGTMRAMIVEVTVENAAQVAQMQTFDQFRRLASAPVLDAEAVAISDEVPPDTESDEVD